MDELRSCYSSQWRLFKDHPEILTPGYFYWNDNAPFYPGPTIFASRNYTTAEIIDPPLGEWSGKQTWRDGSFPSQRPPPVAVGDSTCVGGGDSYPVGAVSRSLPSGVDSRCYTQAGLIAPDPSPALWLRPKRLPPTTPGQPVFTWPDASIFGRDATNFNATFCPTYDTTTFPIAVVDYLFGNTHAVPSFPLQGDYTILVVGCVGVGGVGADPVIPVCNDRVGNLVAPMRIGSSGLGVSTSAGTKRFAIAAGEGIVRLYAIRRVSGVITAYLNGSLVGTFTDKAPLIFTVALPLYYASGPAGNRSFGLVELQCYDQPLSDVGFATLQAALLASYPPG